MWTFKKPFALRGSPMPIELEFSATGIEETISKLSTLEEKFDALTAEAVMDLKPVILEAIPKNAAEANGRDEGVGEDDPARQRGRAFGDGLLRESVSKNPP